MKKFIVLFIAVTTFIACKESVKGENGVVYKNPAEYNDYIVTRQTSLISKILEISKVAQTDLEKADSLLTIYEKQTTVLINEIKGMPAYKGDSSLKSAALKSFTFYKRVFSDDYKKLIEIRKEGGDQTEEGVAEMNRIVENLSKEEGELDKTFQGAQRDFASKHKMRLQENEIQKKIDKMNDE